MKLTDYLLIINTFLNILCLYKIFQYRQQIKDLVLNTINHLDSKKRMSASIDWVELDKNKSQMLSSLTVDQLLDLQFVLKEHDINYRLEHQYNFEYGEENIGSTLVLKVNSQFLKLTNEIINSFFKNNLADLEQTQDQLNFTTS
jgi:hypothetical protein